MLLIALLCLAADARNIVYDKFAMLLIGLLCVAADASVGRGAGLLSRPAQQGSLEQALLRRRNPHQG